jgi:hypothetical protein
LRACTANDRSARVHDGRIHDDARRGTNDVTEHHVPCAEPPAERNGRVARQIVGVVGDRAPPACVDGAGVRRTKPTFSGELRSQEVHHSLAEVREGRLATHAERQDRDGFAIRYRSIGRRARTKCHPGSAGDSRGHDASEDETAR